MGFAAQRPNLEDALEALRRSEQRYRSLVEATASFTWIADPEGALISDVPPWREVTGQSREAVLGAGWLEAIHPEDRGPVAAAWAAAVATRGIYVVDYRIRRAAGGWTHLHVRGAPVTEPDGTVREYVGLCIDVTERKELEATLEQERFLLERVVEQASVAVGLTWGPDHVCRIANARFLDLAPPGRELIGRPLAEALPETTGAGMPQLRQVFDRGVPLRLEEFAVPFDDERAFHGHRYYSVTLTPVPDAAGGTGGVLIVGVESTEDVRRRAALSEALEHQRATAEALQRALLPERLPAVAGLEVASRYVPAGPELLVGGDWFDVLDLGEGRVGFTVGDVAGKGVLAAAIMGQVRSGLRAYALEPHDGPGAVLGRVARFFLVHEPAQMTTLAYAELDVAARTARVASAGHLPLLLLAPGAAPELVWEGRTVPLGIEDPEHAETALGPLAPGTTLVLFTDGLVETRTEPIDEGFARLLAAAEGPVGDLEALCDRLLTVAEDPAGRRDDLALLAVRVS